MKSRLKNAWKELRGNRGSGVLLVMVAIACITLMTTSLLHLSYTGFKIKASERQSKIEFYEAESKMDILLAGIQNNVSIAIGEAQKNTLVAYKTDASLDQTTVDINNTTVFQKTFLDEVEKQLGISGGVYDASSLQNAYFNGDNTITITNDTSCTAVRDDSEKTVVLQNIRLNYKSEKSGNTTFVKTDIVITAPDFFYVKAGSGATTDTTEWNIEEIVQYENWSTY